LEEEFGTDNCVGIVACGKTTLHPTWFLSKASVQRFMDVLSAQVKPATSADTFASLVAGFMQLQDEDNKANVVTIVGAVWQNGRREAAMAIAPVLPWRKASAELLSTRLFWPAWCGIGALGISVALGATGFMPLLTFALGGFASGSALRQVVLATRRQGLRGLVGRTNGGMIVHVGVILIAVALAASNSFTHSQELFLKTGTPAYFSGHSFELIEIVEETTDRAISVKALISIDGGQAYAPAITKYTKIGMNIGTPSVKTGILGDIYLTLEPPVKQDSGEAHIKVFIKPLLVWLWIGGFLMALGTLLAAFPGRRRKPTDATSALIGSNDVE
jgi:cytochrome c-type biogenesis protein CcmF